MHYVESLQWNSPQILCSFWFSVERLGYCRWEKIFFRLVTNELEKNLLQGGNFFLKEQCRKFDIVYWAFLSNGIKSNNGWGLGTPAYVLQIFQAIQIFCQTATPLQTPKHQVLTILRGFFVRFQKTQASKKNSKKVLPKTQTIRGIYVKYQEKILILYNSIQKWKIIVMKTIGNSQKPMKVNEFLKKT